MKNMTLAIAISAVSLIAIPSISHAANEKSGFFVTEAVGQSILNKGVYDDQNTAYSFDAGYRWALSSAFAFGIEGVHTDLGSFSP